MNPTKNCECCGREYVKPKNCSRSDWTTRRFCSTPCRVSVFSQSNLGKKFSMATRRKIAESKRKNPTVMIGAEHPLWVGDRVGYFALHSWVQRWKGRPCECEHCGAKSDECRLHWANIDHKYRRVLEDFIGLCASCHKKFDLAKNHA